MFKISARRLPLVLLLGATSFVTAGTAYAQGTTGTDPCPKHVVCTTGSTGTSTTPTAAKPPTSPSTASVVTQTILVMLGLA